MSICYTILMNQKILLSLGIVLVISGFFFFKPSVKITNYPSSGTTFVAFGDSLIEGVGATPGNDLVSQLSKKIGTPIINLGVAGNTTSQGLARVNQIARYKPKIVFVLLGGNDYLKKIPRTETAQNIERIVIEIQRMGAVVVLLGVQGGILTDPYEDMFEDISERYGTVYVPNVLDGLVADMRYMSDAVHPNDAGYMKIVDKIYPYITKVL